MSSSIPGHHWRDFKAELMEKWHELKEQDLERTRGESHSIIDLMAEKIGMTIEEASEKLEQIASHYHVYNEPDEEEKKTLLPKDEDERVLELKPKRSQDRDMKP